MANQDQKAEVITHRIQFRIRSGEGALTLEDLAWQEFEKLSSDNEKQKFLHTMFMSGFALYRAGCLNDMSQMGSLLANSAIESVDEPLLENKSTVNKKAKAQFGELLS